MFKYVRFIEVELEFTKLTFVRKNEDVKVVFFDKPFVALECEDEELIDELIAYQDELIKCEEITANEFKALVETTSQYSRVQEMACERLEKNMSAIKSKYPESERESWSLQKEEAKKYLATKDETDAPFLKVLADNENDTVESFAIAVLTKNEAFTIMSANAISDKRLYQVELLKELGVV